MGVRQQVCGGSLGTDRRGQYASRGLAGWATAGCDEYPRTEEQIEAAMDLLIQQAHCRLLERATGGLFTWLNDDIVANPGAGVRRRQLEVAPARDAASEGASGVESEGVSSALIHSVEVCETMV